MIGTRELARQPQAEDHQTSSTRAGKTRAAAGIVLHESALSVLKLLALLTMTLDHVDFFAFGGALGLDNTVGRLAMPLFVFVMAYNLCAPQRQAGRDRASRGRTRQRMLHRLMIFGLLAVLPMAMLRHEAQLVPSVAAGVFPLNIMFTLACCVLWVIWSDQVKHLINGDDVITRPVWAAQTLLGTVYALEFMLLLMAGFFVEYHWWVMALFGAFVLLVQRDSMAGLLLSGVCLLALYPFADSFWPVGVLGLIWVAQRWSAARAATPHPAGSAGPTGLETPETPAGGATPAHRSVWLQWSFYAYYPAHMLALLVLQVSRS